MIQTAFHSFAWLHFVYIIESIGVEPGILILSPVVIARGASGKAGNRNLESGIRNPESGIGTGIGTGTGTGTGIGTEMGEKPI